MYARELTARSEKTTNTINQRSPYSITHSLGITSSARLAAALATVGLMVLASRPSWAIKGLSAFMKGGVMSSEEGATVPRKLYSWEIKGSASGLGADGCAGRLVAVRIRMKNTGTEVKKKNVATAGEFKFARVIAGFAPSIGI